MDNHSHTVEFGTEEFQHMPSEKMSLWHIYYSELKALEKQQVQEGFSDLPLSASKQVVKFSTRKVPPPAAERKRSNHQRLGVNDEMDLHKQAY